MTDSLTVALCQVASTTTPAENLAGLPALAERVGSAALVVLPEAFARDFGRPGSPLADDAEPLDGPFVEALTAAAAKQGGTWVAGMFEQAAGLPFNTLVVVDAGGLRAAYRKIHLYDSFGYRESDVTCAGPLDPAVVKVSGWQVGLMTCYDLRFPELARGLSAAGAELLLAPSAWVAGPRKVRHWETLVSARAIENVSYVAAVGQPGPRYTGHSLVVDPRGDFVAAAPGADETVVLATLERALLAEARQENPSLANRRDEPSTLGS